MKNNKKHLIRENIKNIIKSEMTLVQIHKCTSECSIQDIIYAIRELLYQGQLGSKKYHRQTEKYYFNSLDLWSDTFWPWVIIGTVLRSQ